jgi:hypothetical protein
VNWFQLCTYNPVDPNDPSNLGNHPAPVRVFKVALSTDVGNSCGGAGINICEAPAYGQDYTLDITPGSLIDPVAYFAAGQANPSTAPVGNASGGIDPTMTAGNAWPWCVVLEPGVPADYATTHNLPVCPQGANNTPLPTWSTSDANAWIIRGAINAGLAVFLYVQGLEQSAPDPDYNQCQLLPASH